MNTKGENPKPQDVSAVEQITTGTQCPVCPVDLGAASPVVMPNPVCCGCEVYLGRTCKNCKHWTPTSADIDEGECDLGWGTTFPLESCPAEFEPRETAAAPDGDSQAA